MLCMTILKKCINCGKEFCVKPYREHTAKFCSTICSNTFPPHKKKNSEVMAKWHKEHPISGENHHSYKRKK